MLFFDFIPANQEQNDAETYTSMLPKFEISEKLQKEIDKTYLDFLSCFFISARRSKEKMTLDTEMWFLRNIAIYLKIIYPDLSREGLENTLHQILEMSKNKTLDDFFESPEHKEKK
jgi:hypothetical protein